MACVFAPSTSAPTTLIDSWLHESPDRLGGRGFQADLFVYEGDGIGYAGAAGAVTVGLVVAIGKSERDTAHHLSVVAQTKMFANDFGMEGQRGLRHGRNPECLRRQHEAGDIAAAIDRAINPKRLVGVNDRDMRGPEKIEVLQRLFAVGGLVATRDAERVVKLEAAFAPPLKIDAPILARKGKISAVGLAARSRGVDHVAEFPRRRAGCDGELPWLAVAP